MQFGQVVAELDAPVEAKPSEHDVVALMLPSTRTLPRSIPGTKMLFRQE